MTTLPAEIAQALGNQADGARHLRLRSGLDTPTGESHIVVSGGALRVFARASLLDPLVELAGASRARLEVTTLRSELHIEHAGGVAKVSLGYGEQEQVESLLAALSEPQPDAVPVPVPVPVPGSLSPFSPLPPPSSPSLSAARINLLSLLEARRSVLEHASSVGPFASLLKVTYDRAPRRALFEAREAIARGNRDEAVMILAHAGKQRSFWAPRMALGELLFDMGRYAEALGAARRADDAGAPAEVVTPLLERASRAAGDDAALLSALESKRRIVRDKAARRAIEDELRELRQRRERAKAQEPQPARRKEKRTERESAPPPPAKTPQQRTSPKVKARKHDEQAKPARSREASPPVKEAGTQPSMLPWIVLAILVLIGVGAALRRVLGGG
jgi:tetratricopeptide (TPR) repeat protein